MNDASYRKENAQKPDVGLKIRRNRAHASEIKSKSKSLLHDAILIRIIMTGAGRKFVLDLYWESGASGFVARNATLSFTLFALIQIYSFHLHLIVAQFPITPFHSTHRFFIR